MLSKGLRSRQTTRAPRATARDAYGRCGAAPGSRSSGRPPPRPASSPSGPPCRRKAALRRVWEFLRGHPIPAFRPPTRTAPPPDARRLRSPPPPWIRRGGADSLQCCLLDPCARRRVRIQPVPAGESIEPAPDGPLSPGPSPPPRPPRGRKGENSIALRRGSAREARPLRARIARPPPPNAWGRPYIIPATWQTLARIPKPPVREGGLRVVVAAKRRIHSPVLPGRRSLWISTIRHRAASEAVRREDGNGEGLRVAGDVYQRTLSLSHS
jgi:hypothetical protein